MLSDESARKSRSAAGKQDHSAYLLEGWFPVNPKLLHNIQDKIRDKGYSDTAKLVDDIKGDFSLFMYCLRNLPDGMKVGCKYSDLNPVNFLKHLKYEDLASILSVRESQISTHSYSNMFKDQALCLKNALVSASTAEILGEKAGLVKGMSFSCSLLRQIGLNLVAWNYPRIYSRALSVVSDKKSEGIEYELARFLGFNPRSLGIKLALPGKIDPVLLSVLGEKTRLPEDDLESLPEEAALTLKFCEVGESFAKVSDPEHYPVSSREWTEVIDTVNHYIGNDGISMVNSRINDQFVNYAPLAPKVFDGDLSPERNVRLSNLYHGKRLMATNPYVPKCSENLKIKFQSVYSAIAPGEVSTEALQKLVSDVIPMAGFRRGCLYLVDKSNSYLVPRLRIGDGDISRYKPIRCETDLMVEHPVANALFSSIPIKQNDVMLHGERVSHISGSIGNGQQGGVLYLEMSDAAADTLGNEQMISFRAIQCCLNHCLGI